MSKPDVEEQLAAKDLLVFHFTYRQHRIIEARYADTAVIHIMG